ncbi:hypothetical protein NDN08_007330 [Rhodosorus marinus]|uniref:Uncharacterized protein n=1 Tax=Rhodosorus marinus TaxID=101924 RepID=A0AAV8UG95_9RHOD|nr:hypothetical protein NDN08_007330 [Rhodosorus marinus]
MGGKDAAVEDRTVKAKEASPKPEVEPSKKSEKTYANSVEKLPEAEGSASLKVELSSEQPWKSHEKANENEPCIKQLRSSPDRAEVVDGKTTPLGIPTEVSHRSPTLDDLIASNDIWNVLEDPLRRVVEGTSTKQSHICLILSLDGDLSRRRWIRKSTGLLFFYAFRRASVGFWSLADSGNAKDTLDGLRTSKLLSSFQKPLFTFNRNEIEKGSCLEKPYATFRILDTVWNSHSKFSQRNTLLVDEDEERTRFHKLNRVVVPAFSVDEVQAGFDDDILVWLIVYLEFCVLGYTKTGSVQNAIKFMDFDRGNSGKN